MIWIILFFYALTAGIAVGYFWASAANDSDRYNVELGYRTISELVLFGLVPVIGFAVALYCIIEDLSGRRIQ